MLLVLKSLFIGTTLKDTYLKEPVGTVQCCHRQHDVGAGCDQLCYTGRHLS